MTRPIPVKQWVDALRSGKYSQAQEVLCDSSGFCCLGVLSEEAGVPYVIYDEDAVKNVRTYAFPRASGQGKTEETAILPSSAVPLLTDLDINTKVPGYGTLKNHLMTLNDSGHSFNAIADEIERVVALQGP